VSLSQATIDPKALIVSEHDAKLYTGLSSRTLQRLRLDGWGPHFIRTTSKKVAYRVCDLQARVAERLVTSTSDDTVRGVGGSCPTSAQCLKSASCATPLLDWMMTKGVASSGHPWGARARGSRYKQVRPLVARIDQPQA